MVERRRFPPSSTNKGKTNPSGLAFFCLLPRVCAGSCGFLRTAERAISASNRQVLLSVCTFSLRPAPTSTGRSPEGTPVTPIYINGLRADESIGFFVALVGRGDGTYARLTFGFESAATRNR